MIAEYGKQELVIPQDLRDDFEDGRVALFLGAGVSMPAGAPDWETLVAPLRRKLPVYKGIESLDLSQVVALCVDKLGFPPVRAHFQRELNWPRDLSVAHTLIVRLPTNLILTTNYDRYLPDAARAADLEPVVINEDSMVSAYEDAQLKIVQLYGDTANPIAREDDIITFASRHPALALILKHTLLTRRMLFMGFSFRDYNVLNQLLTAQQLLGGHEGHQRPQPPHYAFMAMEDPNEAAIALWHSRRLEIFGYHGVKKDEMSAAFVKFLEALTRDVKQKTYAAIEREEVAIREERRCRERAASSGRPPKMRRESTFSVLAIPADRRLSGFEEKGHALGLERKRLYESWIEEGDLELILNMNLDYALNVRRYTKEQIVARLRTLSECVERHLDHEGLGIALRTCPMIRDSYASFGNEAMIMSETSRLKREAEVSQKWSSVIRDRMAVGVFNDLFDQEMEQFQFASAGQRRIEDKKERRKAGKIATIQQLQNLIKEIDQ